MKINHTILSIKKGIALLFALTVLSSNAMGAVEQNLLQQPIQLNNYQEGLQSCPSIPTPGCGNTTSCAAIYPANTTGNEAWLYQRCSGEVSVIKLSYLNTSGTVISTYTTVMAYTPIRDKQSKITDINHLPDLLSLPPGTETIKVDSYQKIEFKKIPLNISALKQLKVTSKYVIGSGTGVDTNTQFTYENLSTQKILIAIRPNHSSSNVGESMAADGLYGFVIYPKQSFVFKYKLNGEPSLNPPNQNDVTEYSTGFIVGADFAAAHVK